MEKVLFRDNINKITYEETSESIQKRIDAIAAEYSLKDIPVVFGRDFIQDRTVYFIYDLNVGFSKLELETIVKNYLQGKFNEV